MSNTVENTILAQKLMDELDEESDEVVALRTALLHALLLLEPVQDRLEVNVFREYLLTRFRPVACHLQNDRRIPFIRGMHLAVTHWVENGRLRFRLDVPRAGFARLVGSAGVLRDSIVTHAAALEREILRCRISQTLPRRG